MNNRDAAFDWVMERVAFGEIPKDIEGVLVAALSDQRVGEEGIEVFLIRTLLMHMTIDDDRNDVFSHWKGERRSVKQMATEYLGEKK